MKQTMKTFICVVCGVAMLGSLVLLTACNNNPAIITPADNTPTRTTLAVPQDQLTLNDVMAINDPNLKWSRLEGYTHTDNDDGSATFMVADTYGEEATLLVVYDEETDTISKADLSYEDQTASILTDDNFVLLPIMQAMLAKNGITE